MGFKIIYDPTGRAKEYGDLALNIYTGCSFGCAYCFEPLVLKKDRETYHKEIKVRDKLLEKLEEECKNNSFDGKKVHLCFTCDPYQDLDDETKTTREVLKLFKKYNINFQILTKGGLRAARDFDLYKPGDSFGATLTFWNENDSKKYEPNAATPKDRLDALNIAHLKGIKTWASLEPVIYPGQTLQLIELTHSYVDMYKIGTINYNERKKEINWKAFGQMLTTLLDSYGKKYYIKEDLQKAMNT